MMSKKTQFLIGFTLLLLTACLPGASPPTRPPFQAADAEIFAQNNRLGRGVNLGNALEAPQFEGEWGMKIEAGFFPLIRSAGFTHVRLPVRWNAHAQDAAPYTIDAAFFRRVDEVVDQALSAGLAVVLNIHHYEDLMADPAGHTGRFLALWDQIASHYQNYPPELFFELLNEPANQMKAAQWNPLAARALAVVRRSNPRRLVIVGPDEWNGVTRLSGLALPEADRGLIVTFHYYNPFTFTHQGAEWVNGSAAWLGTTWTGTAAQKSAVQRELDAVARWSEHNRRPIYMGEFGAYSQAPLNDRAAWTAFVARSAEERGFSWAYWEFGAGFGVYDRTLRQWNVALLRALVPPQP